MRYPAVAAIHSCDRGPVALAFEGCAGLVSYLSSGYSVAIPVIGQGHDCSLPFDRQVSLQCLE